LLIGFKVILRKHTVSHEQMRFWMILIDGKSLKYLIIKAGSDTQL
jgi:hypothetical protein